MPISNLLLVFFRPQKMDSSLAKFYLQTQTDAQRLLPLGFRDTPIPIPVIKKEEILSLGKYHDDFMGVFFKSHLLFFFGPHLINQILRHRYKVLLDVLLLGCREAK